MSLNQFLALIGSVLQLYAFIPYGRAVLRHEIKPHVFTWFIWSLLASISFAAQLYAGGGMGAWVTFAGALGCGVIALMALRFGTNNITRSDWIAFIAALATIPLWLATDSPVGSVILIWVINLVGFWPTLRKSWLAPHEEQAMVFFLGGVAGILGVMTLQEKNFVTLLYPGWLVFSNLSFVLLLALRRRSVNK